MASNNDDKPLQSVAEKYQSMDQIEHILRRPGMYMGDVHKDKHNVFITEHGVKETIKIGEPNNTKPKKTTKRGRKSKKDADSQSEYNRDADDAASEISESATELSLATTNTTQVSPSSVVETKEIERTRIIMKEIILVPGFMSIIEEVLVNANDQKYRLDQSIANGALPAS